MFSAWSALNAIRHAWLPTHVFAPARWLRRAKGWWWRRWRRAAPIDHITSAFGGGLLVGSASGTLSYTVPDRPAEFELSPDWIRFLDIRLSNLEIDVKAHSQRTHDALHTLTMKSRAIESQLDDRLAQLETTQRKAAGASDGKDLDWALGALGCATVGTTLQVIAAVLMA